MGLKKQENGNCIGTTTTAVAEVTYGDMECCCYERKTSGELQEVDPKDNFGGRLDPEKYVPKKEVPTATCKNKGQYCATGGFKTKTAANREEASEELIFEEDKIKYLQELPNYVSP